MFIFYTPIDINVCKCTRDKDTRDEEEVWVAPPAGNILIELDKDKVTNERTNERTNDRLIDRLNKRMSGWINVYVIICRVRRGELTYYIIIYIHNKCVVGV